MTKVDFTGVSDSFEPIPAGRYAAALTSFKQNKAKESGEPYYALEFTIDDPQWAGRKQWTNNSLTAQSLWMLKRNAIRLGADPDELEGEVDVDELLGDLVGNECRLVISQREYQGTMRNQVDEVLSAAV